MINLDFLKPMLGLGASMFQTIILPGLKAKAEATPSTLDDLGIAALECGLPVLVDGEIEEQECVKAGLDYATALTDYLETRADDSDSPWDNTLVQTLRDAIENVQEVIENPSV